jgi:glycosyltransferase involved in cell wall biosynthesis
VGGVHTYVRQFVPELITLARQHEVFLYADTKRPFELDQRALPSNVTVRLLPYRNALSSLQHDLFLQRTMGRDRLDVAHFPANYGFGPPQAKTVITLHDSLTIMPLLQTLKGSGSRQSARRAALSTYLYVFSTLAVRRADLLLTVSEHARHDIANLARIDANKIVAVPHAPLPGMRRVEDAGTLEDVRARHGLPRHFVLADGLKNPGVLVRAWKLLPDHLKHERKIVFFSRRPDPLPVVFEAVEQGDALLLIRPSTEDLVAMYSMADAFVFPSWFEGFGIPVIESMTCGAPVIASDRYSIPEVAGGAALIADAEDEAAFARHLTSVLGSPDEAARLRRLGYARAAQFSWTKSAQMILDAYGVATEQARSLRAVARGTR